MMNSALVNGGTGKGMKRTIDGIPKAQGLLETQDNTSNSGIIIDLTRKYNDFCIVKECCVVEQIFDLQSIVVELQRHQILLPEKFQIGMVIAKLPLSLRHFSTCVWQREEGICMDDLVASIFEENSRMENVKTNLYKLNNEETDKWACWACRKARTRTSCRRPKNAIQMVKKMILNNATASCEVEKKIKVKDEHFTFQELNRKMQNYSRPIQEVCNRKDMGSGSGSVACWSCRKMGYLTDICARRSKKTEKESRQKKRHRQACSAIVLDLSQEEFYGSLL